MNNRPKNWINFSFELKAYIKKLGYNEKEVKSFNSDMRLYHDLDIYGDSAEEYMEVFQEMGVDMSTFRFVDFFPPEFPYPATWSKLFFGLLPERLFIDKTIYSPITFAMLEKALDAKSWSVIMPITPLAR